WLTAIAKSAPNGCSVLFVLSRALERVPRVENSCTRVGRRCTERRQVAHLPAQPGCGLTVQVELDVRKGEGRRPVRLAAFPDVAEQVRHRRRLQQLGRPERQTADRAQLLLELARAAGGGGEVAGDVRRGWRSIA